MKKISPLISFLMLILTSLACITELAAPQGEPNSATVVAMTLTAVSLQKPQAPFDNQPTQPLSTAPPTSTVQSAAPQPVTQPVPCDRASFVTETILDNTKMSPGQAFTKTWTLKNNGSCTWNASYSVVFDHGEAMGALAVSPLTTGDIVPGQDVQVAVNLTAPNQSGTYQGFFMLKNQNGAKFGLGDNAEIAFWVKIVVEATASSNDETAIKQALLAEMGWSESELEFSISQNTGQYAQGSLKKVGELSGAAWFAAKNSSGQWVIAYIGQGIPYCSEIEPYNLPTEWISHCVDSSGNTVER